MIQCTETKYQRTQREKLEAIFPNLGNGKCRNGLTYKHILQNSTLNLYEEIRDDVQKYLNNHEIKWRCTKKNKNYEIIWECDSEFCGNLKSSMVSCLNHMFFYVKTMILRQWFYKI
jgi:hypothetical protein